MYQKDFDFIKDKLQDAYYLSNWETFIWKYFMKRVFPEWEKGIKEHINLCKSGCLSHTKKCKYCD
jgi:hypothetical protein